MISLTAGHSRKLVIVSRFCFREAVTRVGRRRPGEPHSLAPSARSPRQYRRGYDASPIRMAAPFAPGSAGFARLWRAAIPCRQRATRRSRVGTLPRADTARTGARPDFPRPDYPPSRHAPMFRSAAIRLGLPGRLRPTLLRTGLARAEGRACYRLSARLAGTAAPHLFFASAFEDR